MSAECVIDHDYYRLPVCDCTGVCVRGPRSNEPPAGRRCRCDGEVISVEANMASEQAHSEANVRHEAAQAMKQKCVEYIEAFAAGYVERWTEIEGNTAKAQGWAILQAAQALKASLL